MKTGFTEAWAKFGEVPVNDDDTTDADFEHFPKGTEKLDVWHWFETKYDIRLGEIFN